MKRLKIFLGFSTLMVIVVAGAFYLSNNEPQTSTSNNGPTFTYASTNNTITFYAENGFTNYAWNFGDSSTGTGPIVSHTYQSDGNYTVTLTASPISGSMSPMSTFQQVVIDSISAVIHNYFENLNITMGNAAA